MRKMISLLICLAFLFSCAAAEHAVALPESRYVIDVPDGMEYDAPEDEDGGVQAFVSDTLEMNYRSYPVAEAAEAGMMPTLKESAEALAENGVEAEIYEVNGIEMLVYRMTDDTDGTPCIGYVFQDGTQIVEVFFWYATQDAADTARRIMETIRLGSD